MTPEKRPRLLFDENFGRPGIEALREFLSKTPNGPDVEVRHLLEQFPAGTLDEDWIPTLAAEEGLVLISADRGSKPSRGQRLPRLCDKHGIRHVLLSGGFAGVKMADRIFAVTSVLHQIIGIAHEEKGVRYILENAGAGRGKLRKKVRPQSDAPVRQPEIPFPPSAEQSP